MVGDDANIVFIEFLKQLLEIIKILSSGKNGVQKDKSKTPKQPKIRFGSLSKKDFDKLKKAGLDFKYLTLPKEKLAELEKTAKDIGGSFFSTQLLDGNNAVIAVPSQLMSEIDAAIKHVTAEHMKNDPSSLIVKDGNGKIGEEDMKLTTDVLRSHNKSGKGYACCPCGNFRLHCHSFGGGRHGTGNDRRNYGYSRSRNYRSGNACSHCRRYSDGRRL